MYPVTIERLNQEEALRYMGMRGAAAEDRILRELNACESRLLPVLKPAYTYKVFEYKALNLPGNSIKEHLKGCEKVIFLCATVGGGADRLIRQAELTEMSAAFLYDTLASVAVEQVCERAEQTIHSEMPEWYMTWRFGVGYGDFPLSYQPEFLRLTDASRQLGVTLTDSNILLPRKTVTCIIGLSKKPVTQEKKGCQSCNLKDRCAFRKRGEHCVF